MAAIETVNTVPRCCWRGIYHLCPINNTKYTSWWT